MRELTHDISYFTFNKAGREQLLRTDVEPYAPESLLYRYPNAQTIARWDTAFIQASFYPPPVFRDYI